MRIILIVILFCISPVMVPAQSLAQEIEQLVLDYEKLGQLKELLKDMKTAYGELAGGYEAIKGIAKGNFNLHADFLNRLLAVSPVVRDYAQAKRIIDNEAELVREYQAASRYFSGSRRFAAGELDYFASLYGNLLAGSLRNLDELAMVLTAGELRMSDGERLTAIDRIDQDMRARLDFFRVFVSNAAIVNGQRGLEEKDVGAMHGVLGLK